jgi:uncharacterized repeat protein (TIGR01451 family)
MSIIKKSSFSFLAFFLICGISLAQSTILDITTHSDVVNDSDNSVGSGDVIVFTTKVENISNIAISNFTITNTLIGIDDSALSLSSQITFVGNSGSSPQHF